MRHGCEQVALVFDLPLDARGHVVDRERDGAELARVVSPELHAAVEASGADVLHHAHEVGERAREPP